MSETATRAAAESSSNEFSSPESFGRAPSGQAERRAPSGRTFGSDVDVDAEVVAGEAPPSSRQRLDRARIVAAGLAYIDEFDLPGLTMRRLGTALGVEAMALYRYVPSKEELLDAIVDAMIEEMRAGPQMLDSPAHGWQDFLQRLAHGVRRVALAHPRAFPLVVARPPEAPWLRPPLRNLEWVETFLDGLCAEGFDDEGAVEAYRAFTSFLLGHLLLEVAVYGADVGPLDTTEDHQAADLDGFPTVERLRDRLAHDESAREFEESLEKLLERLSRTRLEHLRPDERPSD